MAAKYEAGVGTKTAYIESFNARFRDELLNGEIFYSLREAQIVIEQWRRHTNTKRRHSAIGAIATVSTHPWKIASRVVQRRVAR